MYKFIVLFGSSFWCYIPMCGLIYKLFYKAGSADKVASRSKKSRPFAKQTARESRAILSESRSLRLGGVVTIAIFCLVILSCNTNTNKETKQEKEEIKQIEEVHLRYTQDLKTGLCFAHYWGGDLHGSGPAMSMIPCSYVCVVRGKSNLHQTSLPTCIK
ncbi:hypothetical protein LCGC14_0991220 [marine sediment metagenome]|uniref:Uncharacterized protein n=1 Tax=marine sediment metagenome TaxID=412755 RepID=A0A0F9N5R1_9ZZZZ